MKTNRIFEVRRAFGLSQEGFARLLGMSAKTIFRHEQGCVSAPRRMMFSLSSTLSVSLDDAAAICDGSIGDSRLRVILARVRREKGVSRGKPRT